MKCKVCNNEITLDRGIRGSHGVDVNGDPIPFWTVDPLKTPLGLAGQDYIGKDPMRRVYLKELQDYYNLIEEEMGLIKTDFLDTTKLNTPIRRVYIEQLRVCIEKILNGKGMTLQDYFCNDRLGNVLPGKTQNEWTDVDRSADGLPRIPKNAPLKGVYIEELRRGIMIFSILCITPIDKPDKQSGMGYFHYDVSGDKVVRDFNMPNYFEDLILSTYNNFYSESKFLYLLYSIDLLKFKIFNTTTKTWGIEYEFQFADTDINNTDCSHLTACILEEQKSGGDKYDINYNLFVSELFYKRIGITPPDIDLSKLWNKLPYYIAKYSNIKSRLLGTSNGIPSQTFSIGSKINWSLISTHWNDDNLFVLVSGNKWIRVSDFVGSNATDKHYTLNSSGIVTFGDGVNGMIPANTSKIAIEINLYLSNYLKWEFEETIPENVILRDKTRGYTYIRGRKDTNDYKLYTAKVNHPIYFTFPHIIQVNSVLSNWGHWEKNSVFFQPHTVYDLNTVVNVEGTFNTDLYGDITKINHNLMYNWKDKSKNFSSPIPVNWWITGFVGAAPDLVNDNQVINVDNNSFNFKTPVAKLYKDLNDVVYWEEYQYLRWQLYNINPRNCYNLPISYIHYYYQRVSLNVFLGAHHTGKTYIKILALISKNVIPLNSPFNNLLNYKIYLMDINGHPVLPNWDLSIGEFYNWTTGSLPNPGYTEHQMRKWIYGIYGYPSSQYFCLEYTSDGFYMGPKLLPFTLTFKIQLCDDSNVEWFQKVYGFTPTKEYIMQLIAN